MVSATGRPTAARRSASTRSGRRPTGIPLVVAASPKIATAQTYAPMHRRHPAWSTTNEA